MTLSIDVVSDVVCPWCFIGERKLKQAIRNWQEEHPEEPLPSVHWHAFQLNPDLPASGMPRGEYLERKFRSKGGGRNYERVRAAGAGVGIDFAFERIERQPNTLEAHALIALAAEGGRQDELVDAFFRAYFLDGEDLSDRATLLSIAQRAGVDREVAELWLSSAEARDAVAASDRQTRKLGIQGVPFFIFNRRVSVSGAQDPQVLVNAMHEAAADGGDDLTGTTPSTDRARST